MFERRGVVRAKDGSITEDELLENLIDFDIVDITKDENLFSIVCDIKSLEDVKKAVADLNLTVESSDLEWVPKTATTLPDDQAQKAYVFLSSLDDHDDVQNVYTNLA